MGDVKGSTTTTTMNGNKLAMSKALGAAFLSHQVEQLEQKVVGSGRGGGGGSGGGGNNWREGRRGQGRGFGGGGGGGGEQQGRRGGGVKGQGRRVEDASRRWRDDGDREKNVVKEEKEADVVVVDASVLVHGLSHLKKWCRESRHEIVIIPLEALNTLDLLKKGTSSLAQRARAASRILEAQVGTNPRIRVQRDDAFVLWDDIPFSFSASSNNNNTEQVPPSPEWVRRTICCARWEIDHATTSPHSSSSSSVPSKPNVVLAVCTPDVDSTSTTPSPNNNHNINGNGNGNNVVGQQKISASPVPLPAPTPNKFEPRSAGTLVHQWATRAGIRILEVPSSSFGGGGGGGGGGGASVVAGDGGKDGAGGGGGGSGGGGRRSGEYGRRSPVDDRRGGGRRGGYGHGHGHGFGGYGGGYGGYGGGYGQGAGKPLVERPPAVMAMMEAVAQPSRVVRVLARGEKLDAN